MNAAHIHLALNHFPLALPLVALVILIIGFIFKNDLVKRIAFGMMMASGIFTFLMMNSGEGAEEIVEELGRSHDLIHEHEEKAETFALLSYLSAVFAAIAFWINWKRKPFSDITLYLSMILCVVLLYLGQQTGSSGGEITHEEIVEK
jgi:uncharacterized membrane protein